MVEKLRFLDSVVDVVIDLDDEHSCGEVASIAFVEHLPVVAFESDDGLSVHEILGKVAEHVYSCSECLKNIELKTVRGY